MSHQVETMAYAKGVKPWHGLGVEVSNDLTPRQMAIKAGLDWKVSKEKLFVRGGKSFQVVPDRFALMRDSDNTVLSIVSPTYKPVQNLEALDFFSKFVEAGQMQMETAGSLRGGKNIWGMARLGKDFKVGKGDTVQGNLLLSQPHSYGESFTIKFTPVCVVCWNTLTYALGSGLDARGNTFRMPHSVEFNKETQEAAKEALGLATDQMEAFEEAAKLLASKTIKAKELDQFFFEVLSFDPEKAVTNSDGSMRAPRMLSKLKSAVVNAPGQQLGSREGTLWGAVNAVTYVVDHELGRSRETGLFHAWMGYTAGLKRKALNIALERAK